MKKIAIYERKIVELRPRSYIVTLPRNYVLAQGLKAGDIVIIELLDDGSLHIIPKNRTKIEGIHQKNLV